MFGCTERADVWWSSLLRTRFEDGAVEVGWDEFVRLFRAKFVLEHIQDKMEQEFLSLTQSSMTVLEYEARFAELSKYAPHIVADEHRKAKKFVMGLKPSLRTRLVAFDHRTLEQALSAACRQEGEMEQYLEEKKASQKRPTAPFQRQERKKTTFQSPQRPVASGSGQVSSQRSPSGKKECPHCERAHGGTECWLVAGKCLKCGSSDHKIKDCSRLQQGAQRGPAPVAATAAPATGRPGRPRAPARVFSLAREDAEQADHVTEGTLALESGLESEDLEVPLSVHTPAGTVSTRRVLAEGHLGVNLKPFRRCQRPDMDANTNPGVQRYGRQSLWPACAAELQASETRKPSHWGFSPTALRAVISPKEWVRGLSLGLKSELLFPSLFSPLQEEKKRKKNPRRKL
ncbi:hypothetical protein Taro_012349 [Colocasia esculenta]|uniref:Retrotransposon gag domain-containing protein n=1 Tax=Colocasia esculenta TaxID=4460 RepID=A0A843U3R4_COLES|nr:hypothetical protein [Colocasia esculenta]